MADELLTVTQQAAANLPWEVRVAAYGQERGLSPSDALEELAELGLRHVLEDRLLADPHYRPSIYLWRSYLALMADAEASHG